MSEERNIYQIIRKDAKNCFVESLSDSFGIGKIHLGFTAYDASKPAGERQTDNVQIYISVDEFLELYRKLISGEMRFILQNKKKNSDKSPIYQSLGGTSAERLATQNHERKDGKSLSRTVQLLCSSKSDFLLVADSGPGETTEKGLIVPKFGKNPENHVAISLTFETFAELILTTYVHYSAWLNAFYMQKQKSETKPKDTKVTKTTEDEGLPF